MSELIFVVDKSFMLLVSVEKNFQKAFYEFRLLLMYKTNPRTSIDVLVVTVSPHTSHRSVVFILQQLLFKLLTSGVNTAKSQLHVYYRNTSLIRPYKWGCLISEAHQSTFQAISPDQIGITFRWLDKKKWKISSFHCGDSQKWESARTRCRVPYKWDIFIFEWGDSPYRPVRWGINGTCSERLTHLHKTSYDS